MIRRSWAVFSTLDCHQAILTQRLNHRHFLNVRRYFKLVNMKDSDALHLENIAITSISTAFLMCPRHIIYEYHRLWSTFCVNDFVCCHVGVEAYEREWQMQFNNFTVNKIIWISPASCSLVHTNTKTHSHMYKLRADASAGIGSHTGSTNMRLLSGACITMVAFSSLLKILGECLTTYSTTALKKKEKKSGY